VFHTDIAKWIGTLHMLRWLYTYSSIFQTLLQVCLSRCCICSTHMLQVFYLHVACVQWFSSVFRCFCKCFRRMFHLFSFYTLQVLHLDISKVDRVLHMRCMWETGGGVSFPVRAARAPARACETQAPTGSTGPTWTRKMGRENGLQSRASGCGRLVECLDASSTIIRRHVNTRSGLLSNQPFFSFLL
jgi:hypothetical protein